LGHVNVIESANDALELDNSLIENIPIQEPKRSPKHEAAIMELKNYISQVLQSKMEEIKSSVAQKIIEQDPPIQKGSKADEDKKKQAPKKK
jgi:hypothetical protein